MLVYKNSYKNLIGAKPECIRFGKVDRFIGIYERTRHLVLFGPEKHVVVYNRIRYLKSQKRSINYVYSPNYAKIKVDSYYSFPLENTLTFA